MYSESDASLVRASVHASVRDTAINALAWSDDDDDDEAYENDDSYDDDDDDNANVCLEFGSAY